jgi:uncharacterized repeat protein (TIGR03843 family)
MTTPVEPVEQSGPELVAFDRGAALRLLMEGELEIVGRLVEASNATLYCRVRFGGKQAACVYKPVAGERPLWDFPDGTLAGREVAAYAVSEAGGWGTVPPTVLRDGPFGPGMCQLWIDVDESWDVVAMLRGSDPRLRPIALFDAVVNNADRKGGHLLPTETGRIFAVDHGVCFAATDKLRTLLWNWAGEPLAREEYALLRRLRSDLDNGLGVALEDLLTPEEIKATAARVDRLLASGTLPVPTDDWPAVPWPPF